MKMALLLFLAYVQPVVLSRRRAYSSANKRITRTLTAAGVVFTVDKKSSVVDDCGWSVLSHTGIHS